MCMTTISVLWKLECSSLVPLRGTESCGEFRLRLFLVVCQRDIHLTLYGLVDDSLDDLLWRDVLLSGQG